MAHSSSNFSPVGTLSPPTDYSMMAEAKSTSSTEKDIEHKLSTSKVFEKIRPLICSINSIIGESSGFVFKGTLLTVAHNIPIEKRDDKHKFTTTYVQVHHSSREKPYFPKASDDIIEEHAKALDLFSMKSEILLSESDVIPVLPDEIQLKEGIKVYFAGYPLGHDKVTFHKGTISSVSECKGIKRFTIDGTVVPGNSGGPVVIQHQGKVYLVGVITSEVADFSPEDQKTIAIMKALSESKSKSKQPLTGKREMNINQHGITTSIEITTPEGVETVQINDRETTVLALDLIQRNLSTGIGKAIDIRDYHHLFEKEPKLTEAGKYSFPVAGKGKKLISGTLVGEKNVKLAQYVEVRYGKSGSGNRGIRIISDHQTLPPGTHQYKFAPNPHTAQGNYNKNQEELYSQAAKTIVTTAVQNGQFPQSIVFNACQFTYTASED